MGRIFDQIDEKLADWLLAQFLFFVATAPSAPDGHVNLSPKGGAGVLRILGPNRIAYLDFVGSGAETIAHLRENGRIVLMFCAFDGPPKVIRLHGTGIVISADDPEYPELLELFAPDDGFRLISRSIIVVDVERIADSCGFVVPRMELSSHREQLVQWAEKQERQHGQNWKASYIQANNTRSIDGLPALDSPDIETESGLAAFSSNGRAL
ncbi:MAG: pyridoxamine 5'-phosphate oxidase family protein [Thermomicrobiales bacterium]|nr:pyridoxamine 5'-phosphate oxidase family protein [Thermomicrobiales bacterium]